MHFKNCYSQARGGGGGGGGGGLQFSYVIIFCGGQVLTHHTFLKTPSPSDKHRSLNSYKVQASYWRLLQPGKVTGVRCYCARSEMTLYSGTMN